MRAARRDGRMLLGPLKMAPKGLRTLVVKAQRKLMDEEIAAARFTEWLKKTDILKDAPSSTMAKIQPSKSDWQTLVKAGMATFALHVTARVFAFEGRAFYTIGPCGEEFAGVWGCLLNDNDSSALHYRHLASQVARQLKQGKSINDILLDRARGYACSSLDPVTGGRHCALGGGPNDFYVTSTLASQAPSAIGRALGGGILATIQKQKDDTIHFVSFGDGSVANAQFLATKNLAENASFRGIRCPLLMCITDNDISISFKGHGWIEAFSKTFLVPTFFGDGHDILSTFEASYNAFESVRKTHKPAALFIRNVNRRFGHAATDRQSAYLTQSEIEQRAMDNTILESIVTEAIRSGAMTMEEATRTWEDIRTLTTEAFEKAANEPKLDSIEKIASVNKVPLDSSGSPQVISQFLATRPPVQTRMTMRKAMTRAIHDEMDARKNLVYLGEDVRHGGYYLVTEGVAQKFGHRIVDFPPDETTLIGCAQGFSQRGLLPVVEIPYLKYLDCGADQFFEVALTHWCTNGRQKHGLVIRMQGFDRGVFGGNFHTHNSLYMPPGVDFLCFSNGYDWVRGFRAALDAAEKGRIVAIVDPTHALNKRDVDKDDDAWLCEYPERGRSNKFQFEDIIIYSEDAESEKSIGPKRKRLIVVTYGNGVPDAILCQKRLIAEKTLADWQIDVVEVPLLSSVPRTLEDLLLKVDAVLFADCCKTGQNPYAGFIQCLGQSKLPKRWACVAAADTYNPLSRTETFLSAKQIMEGIQDLVSR